MIGYKGFDENLRCYGFQYEIGGEYQHDGEVVVCEQGFHFCENPLDVLNYYAPGTSRYAVVEGSGHTDRMQDEDSKVACSHLKVVAELTLRDLIQAGVEFVLETAATKGAAAATDYGAHAVTTGDRAHAVTTGPEAHAAATGRESIAAGLGVAGRAKGALGCWLVLAEYEWTEDDGYRIAAVEAVKVDGKRIKPDTWYELQGGRFVEVVEDEGW